MEVAKSPNLEQSGVQMDGELPTLAADNHIEQVTGAVPTTNPRGVVMTGKVAKSNNSGKIAENPTNKRVIYIVAGDDGSHVPTLRQVKLHGEKATKSDAKTIAAAARNLFKGAAGKQPVRRGTVHLSSDICQEQSTEVIDEDAERISAVQFEKSTNSVDHSPQNAQEQNVLHDIMEINETSSSDTSSESDLETSSGSESEKETGRFFYPSPEVLDIAKQPEVGMKFPTLEYAHEFYNTYALQTGFVAVRGRNYKRQKFQLDCNRSGKGRLVDNPNRQRKRKRNIIQKTNCQAKVIVKLVNGQWELTAVQNEHNHPLCPSPSFAKFLMSKKHMSAEERSFSRVLQQCRVPPKKIMKIIKRMRGSFGKIPSEEKQAGNVQTAEQRRKANSDVEKTLNRFMELQLRDPCFFYTMQKDGDNIVRSIFWTNARSRMDYETFGDFISFDTTCSTNRHNMPFTPIIGINNYGRTIVLGCALLQDQRAETYKWMLHTFLQEMGGNMPRVIITNQDEGMAKAIAEVMPQVRHRFCKWDVMGKAQEKLAALAARGNIKGELDNLVDNSLIETEFEEGWSALIERYDASENEYLQFMWQTRKKWAPVYFREDFYPFIVSAGGSQGTISLFKGNVLPKDRIEKFIEKYEEIQDMIIKMDEEDGLQSGTEPSCFSLQPIERHAAHIYTRQIFLKVQKELLHSTAFKVQEIQRDALYRLEKVFNYENPEYDRNSFEVLVEPGTNVFNCQCAKFSRDGILCCHIFRLLTQFGICEIPEKYIVPRWTDKYDEQLKQYKEKCLEIQQSDNTMRYAMLMSKVSDIGKQICGDSAKCNMLMVELDKIQEKMAAMTVENLENNHC
ncbi:protein FAR1-RELATED SEQUENCE 5-like [Lolium rigidum]|uniref:protein FAR1-RELATED SEQUENCE 5-like n=1 Tax=Lolium rigidum TaxID=89674 RepID=UPI001F5D86BC|nr:protein FAR1-RELATED SEQUENCE 5-like [Lolium rigidum]